MRIDEKIEAYLVKEGVVDAKVLKIAKDPKSPTEGNDAKTLFLLMSDIYDLPENQIVAQLRKIAPDVDSSKTINLIKKIKKAVSDWQSKGGEGGEE